MDNESSASNPATGPNLLSPRAETVVDAGSVTFKWAPVEGAPAYRLEVATDSSFEEVLHAEEVRDRTEKTISGLFEADDTLYYWRVRVKTDRGWTPGEKVESFVASDAEMAGQQLHLPQEDEKYGPSAALTAASSVEAAADVTGREALFEKEREMGVAHEGVEAKQIFVLIGTVVIILAGIIVTLIIVTQLESQGARFMAAGSSGYPELRQSEQQATELLETYGYVEGEEGVYRIPLEEAQELLLNENRMRSDSAYAEELSVIGEN